jgi:hypothetical protein
MSLLITKKTYRGGGGFVFYEIDRDSKDLVIFFAYIPHHDNI